MSLDKPAAQAGALGWVMVPDPGNDPDVATIRYDEFVRRLFKKLPTFNEDLMHAALGVCGEAGELGDAIKRAAVYGKPIDRANVIEELGDLRFYIQAVQNLLGIPEHVVLQHNAVKLSERYAKLQYSDAAAIARADKSPGT